MIPVKVTQTQEENDNPTMALPFWDTFFVPQIPEKKMTQKTLNYFENKFVKKSGPTHEFVPVNEHVRGDNTFITTQMRKMKINKKESKTNNSKKKTGKTKHGAFPKLEDDYKNKGDTPKARSMHLGQLMELARGNKK